MRTALKRLVLMRGGFSPAAIPGLQLWLDASDASTLFQDSAGTTPAAADNDVVGYWGDKSGNGYHAAQGTTANKPLLKLATKNNLPVVYFDGLNDWLSASIDINPGVAPELTVIALVTLRNSVGVAALFGHDNGGYDRFVWNSAISTGSGTATFPGFPVNGTYKILCVQWNQGVTNGTFVYLNGSKVYTTTATHGSGTTSVGIGSIASGGPNQASQLNACEFLFYNRMLTESELAAINSYLNAKWAVY